MLVGVVVAEDAAEAVKIIENNRMDLYEVRVDSFIAMKRLELLDSVASRSIFTLRRPEEGGLRTIASGEKIEIFRKLIEMHPKYVDIEYCSPLRNTIVKMARDEGVEVIISYHDLKCTPEYQSLSAMAERMSQGDLRKIVTYARRPKDNLSILRLYERYDNIVAFCMGKIGRISRLMSYYFAPFTYTALSERVADGQFTVETMRKLIEVMENG